MNRYDLRWPYSSYYSSVRALIADEMMSYVVLPSAGPTRASTISEMMFEMYQSWVDAPMRPGVDRKSIIQQYRWEWDCGLLSNRDMALNELCLCSRSVFVDQRKSDGFAYYKCGTCVWIGLLCQVCFENCHVKQGHDVSRISSEEYRRLQFDSSVRWKCPLGYSSKEFTTCECLRLSRVHPDSQPHNCTRFAEFDRMMTLSSTVDLSSQDAMVQIQKKNEEEILVRFRPMVIGPRRTKVVDRTIYHAGVIKSFVKSYPRALIPNYIICRWVRTSKCQTLPDFLRSRCFFGHGMKCRAWELELALYLASSCRDECLLAMVDRGLSMYLVLRCWQSADRLFLVNEITPALQTIIRVASGTQILRTRGKRTRYWDEAQTTLLHDLIRIRRAKRHTIVPKANLIAELCRLDPFLVSIPDETGDLPIDVLFRTTRRERKIRIALRDRPESEIILRAFLEAGSDPSRVDRHGLSVLQKACRSFAFECAERLLDAGAARPDSASDLFLRSPVTLDRLSRREDHLRILSFLRKLDRGIPFGRDLLCYAMSPRRNRPAAPEFCAYVKGELGLAAGDPVDDVTPMSFSAQECRYYRRPFLYCGYSYE